MEKQDDTFLSRWLSGGLDDDQRNEFEQSEDFHLYQKIVEASGQLKTPEFNKQKAFTRLQAAKNRQSRVRKISLTLSMAASIALLIFGAGVLTLQERVTCDYGQQASVLLPDGSEVFLNARSELSYNKWNWSKKRKVKLKGEAYFSVKKDKAPFIVQSNQGVVEVLGTQFNVRDNDSFYEISCYSGKVGTLAGDVQHILTKDMGLRLEGNHISHLKITQSEPSWISGETSLDNVDLNHVLTLLSEQYELTFINSGVDLNQHYTGTFTNKNVDIALKTVCSALEINYKLSDNKVTLFE
jgi:ferric-dicitrate binding protein FerR (iron transport regulator)